MEMYYTFLSSCGGFRKFKCGGDVDVRSGLLHSHNEVWKFQKSALGIYICVHIYFMSET